MNDVEEVKERLNVADVVANYIPLKQAGRNFKAPCPFHHEKTASFMVSPEKGIWHCFGCGEGGDILAFVMKYEGLDFPAALEKLAGQAGVELKPRSTGGVQAKAEKEKMRQAVALAVRYYQASLIKNKSALEYAIKTRRLNKQTLTDFEVGYAPDDWTALSHFLVKKGFSQGLLNKAGLVGQKSGENRIFDLFRGRLMFPIHDTNGAPVAFTGRILSSAEDQPKYINTPQTPLYDKSRIIFGLHLAKPAIRKLNEVVLVEGNMDVLMSHQVGVKQVVAVSGTALTTEQLKALSHLTKNFKLCFDADDAGLRATERAIELSQNLNIKLSVVELSQAKDPDELIAKGLDGWKQAIAKAKYALDYLFERFESEYNLSTASGKREYSDRLASSLRALKDPVEQDHYVKLLASKLNIGDEAVRQKLNQEVSPRQLPRPAATTVVPVVKPSKDLLEESALSINLAYPEVRLSLEKLTPAHFGSTDHQAILETLQRKPKATVEEIAEHLPNQADYVRILSLRGEETYGSFAPADRSYEAFMLVRRLQISSNKDTKSKLSKKLREAEASGDDVLAKTLLAQFQALIAEDD